MAQKLDSLETAAHTSKPTEYEIGGVSVTGVHFSDANALINIAGLKVGKKIKIPSPDNKNRFIPLDLFPSELLERLEVSKSLTPSMEGDAIGGTINLVMKDAPSKLLIFGNLAIGYNNSFGLQNFYGFNKSSIINSCSFVVTKFG